VRSLLSLRRRADFVLAFIDMALAAIACWAAYELRFEGQLPLPTHFFDRYLYSSIGVCVGYVLAGRITGLYRRAALRLGNSNIRPALEASLGLGAALIVVDYAALNGDLSRAWVLIITFLLLLASLGSRALLARGRRALVPFGVALERFVVVGNDELARRLTRDLTRAAGAPFRIVAVLPLGLEPAELARQAKAARAEALVFAADAQPEHVTALAAELAGAGVDVLIAPRLGQLDVQVVSVVTMQGIPLLRMTGAAPRRRAITGRPSEPANRVRRRGVAILGTRGIPANYGGFETFAERLSLQFVQQGIPVTVYCRSHHATDADAWNGVRLVTLPTIRHKYLDTVVHTLLSAAHLILRTRVRDVILCNAANAPVLPLLRLARRRVLMNVDGLEWRRGKWGVAGRSWYRMGEWLSVRLASVLITDADEVRSYYRVRHDRDSVMIPYGADLLPRSLPLPAGISVPPGGYALYVSRWEPENNPLLVARAHRAAGATMPLVMLGKSTYDEELDRAVHAAAAHDAVLPGPIFGEGYRALQANARCYIHATEVGGTHPALIEAMAAGNLCLVLDTPENREVAGSEAWYFGYEAELVALLRKVAELQDDEVSRLGDAARARASRLFSWQAVASAYLRLVTDDRSSPQRSPSRPST
jgi:glycosyltransferase involved in cell wall biosynthesis